MNALRVLVSLLAAYTLNSCATRDSRPVVRVLPNDSGLVCSDFAFRPPHNFLGEGWDMKGRKFPPDTPSGMRARVERSNPIRVKGSRYMVSASGSLAVVSIERPGDYRTKYYDMEEDIQRLRRALTARAPEIARTHKGGDEIPWMNAGSCFQAKARVLDFPWGRGLLYLTTCVLGSTGAPVNNDMLVLVVQGLTTDGRYAVSGHFDIRHPRLPDTMDDDRAKGRAIFALVDQDAAAEAWLNRQPGASFQPTLAQYEILLRALEITPG